VTSVERLDDSGRIEELARMIGGSTVGEQVRATAQELLSRAATKGERRKRKS